MGDRDLLSGPGKLCKSFGITGEQNGIDLLCSANDGRGGHDLIILAPPVPISHVITAPRVGIAEGKWHDVPWRFIDAEKLPWVSRPRPKVS